MGTILCPGCWRGQALAQVEASVGVQRVRIPASPTWIDPAGGRPGPEREGGA